MGKEREGERGGKVRNGRNRWKEMDKWKKKENEWLKNNMSKGDKDKDMK